MKTENKVQAINEYLESQGYHDDMIYTFDEYLINEFFPNSFDALRACHFGDINFTHNYFRFDRAIVPNYVKKKALRWAMQLGNMISIYSDNH